MTVPWTAPVTVFVACGLIGVACGHALGGGGGCSANNSVFNPAPGYPVLAPTDAIGDGDKVAQATGDASAWAIDESFCGDQSGTAWATSENCQLDRITISPAPPCSAILSGVYTLSMESRATATAHDCQDEEGQYLDRGEAKGRIRLVDDAGGTAGPSDCHRVAQEASGAPVPVVKQCKNNNASYSTPAATTPGCVTAVDFWGTVEAYAWADHNGKSGAHG